MVVLLVDDERSFKDERECVVVKSVAEAIEVTDSWDSVEELWLDYILLGVDSSDEFLFHLKRRKHNGNPLNIGRAYIHTSAYGAVSLLVSLLESLDVPKDLIQVVDHKEVFVTK